MTGKVPKKAIAHGIIEKEIQKLEERSNVTIIQTKSTTNFTDIFQKLAKCSRISYVIAFMTMKI